MINKTNFHGRGNSQNPSDDYLIKAEPGFVHRISILIGPQAFLWGYSRKLRMEPWGLRVFNPFRRCSSSDLKYSWAEHFAAADWIFKPAIIELIREEPWMRTKRKRR